MSNIRRKSATTCRMRAASTPRSRPNALPGARHPDLVRLQEEARVSISEQIDRRRISPQTGTKRMREVDALITRAERDRDAGNIAAANRHRIAIDYLLVQ